MSITSDLHSVVSSSPLGNSRVISNSKVGPSVSLYPIKIILSLDSIYRSIVLVEKLNPFPPPQSPFDPSISPFGSILHINGYDHPLIDQLRPIAIKSLF